MTTGPDHDDTEHDDTDIGWPVVTDPAAPRRRWRRPGRRALIAGGSILAALIIAGAVVLSLSQRGPGPGPLSVGFVSSSGIVPAGGRAMIVIPVGAAPPVTAVIDAVSIHGGGGYRAPKQLGVVGVTSPACAGLWHPVAGPGGFTQRCAPAGTVPLIGRAVPRHPAATGAGSTGIDIGIEVGPPGKTGCWGIGRVAVRYHVGDTHYTVVTPESLSGCLGQ
jgi:hypothetical protein